MTYKALIADVDRTLIVSEKALTSAKVKSAVLSLKGIAHFGLATSRPYSKVKHLCKDLGLTGPQIVSNGAQIVDATTGKYYSECCISSALTLEVCQLLQTHDRDMKFWIQDEGKDYEYTDDYAPAKPFVIVAYGITDETADQILTKLRAFDELAPTKVPSYEAGLVDIHMTHQDGTKQAAVVKVAKILGIATATIIGVGDGHNDLSLLQACGLKIAMGNAIPELQAIADHTTASVEDDGLAQVIETYFKNKD